MSKKKYLVISEDSLYDYGQLTETIEQARANAKERAADRPSHKYFIMEGVEYGICDITPCTFFAPEYLVNEVDEMDAIPHEPQSGRIRSGRARTITGTGRPPSFMAQQYINAEDVEYRDAFTIGTVGTGQTAIIQETAPREVNPPLTNTRDIFMPDEDF